MAARKNQIVRAEIEFFYGPRKQRVKGSGNVFWLAVGDRSRKRLHSVV
jgi:hypothetical protein